MKKSVNLFFLILCSLFTTFFYQNCSEVENTSVVTKHVEYLPLFTNQLKLFETDSNVNATQNSCAKMHDVLFSSQHNLCFEVSDSCAFATLAAHGFTPVNHNLGRKLEVREPVILSNAPVMKTANSEMEFASVESADESASTGESELKALIHNCQIFVDINDLKPTDFLVIKSKEIGYQPDPDLQCSLALEPLVNFKTRTCMTATDGCESSYLKKQGFVNDYYSVCPQAL